MVSINIQYVSPQKSVNRSLFDIFKLSTIAKYENPIMVFRYVIAAVVVVLSFVLGFALFGRIAGKGIEALGRNPLASKIIQFGIAVNVLITIAIIAAGIGLAMLIIKI